MTRRSAWVRLGAVAVAAGLFGSACTDTLTDANGGLTVAVSPATVTLASLGEQTQLAATVTATRGAAPAPIWVTRNVDVAAVGDDGRVRAVGNGETWVVALAEADGIRATDSARVVVAQAPVALAVAKAVDTLTWLGATTSLTAVAMDALGSPIEDALFDWQSSAPDRATVDSAGMVTAVANGAATITASLGGVTGSIALAVAQQVASVTVAPASPSIAVGNTQQFTATAYDAGSSVISGVNFLWVSADANLAVVDTTGLATGKGVGAVTITAVGRGQPGNAVLTVGSAPTAPTQVAFSVQPTSTTAGQALSPAIEVEIRDASGNLVTSARNAVTLSIAANPGGATLAGTKTVTAVNGVASFSGLWMNKAAAGYTLSATASGLTGATSTAFAISPGAPTQVAFGTQPTNAQGNVVLAPAVTATVIDAFGNVATGATNAITVDFGTNIWKSVFSPGATLGGTKTVNAVSGVATFGDLTVDKPGPGYTLAAQATGLTGGTSNPFMVNLTVQSMAAASDGFHTCAVTSGGAYCWGSGYDGQLGQGRSDYDSVAALVVGGLTFTQVAGGRYHSCGITSTGAAYCWGYNGYGQLGDNSYTATNEPVAVSGGLTFSSIAAGGYHTCGVSGTSIYCWGNDGFGQLGDDAPIADKLVPTIVAGGTLWGSVSTGRYHTCGLSTGGDAYCWGYDGYGALGDTKAFANQPTPVTVKDSLGGVRTWKRIRAGVYHSCGIDANDDAFCWGRNAYGQLGVDTTAVTGTPVGTNRGTPIAVFGALKFSRIAPGYDHTCGLTTSGAAYCWGINFNGELGIGSTGDRIPIRSLVLGSHVFSELSAGYRHTCGQEGTEVWCWGDGGSGQLGNASTADQTSPVKMVQ